MNIYESVPLINYELLIVVVPLLLYVFLVYISYISKATIYEVMAVIFLIPLIFYFQEEQLIVLGLSALVIYNIASALLIRNRG